MKYVVLLDGQTIEVEVDGDRVTVDGRAHSATLARDLQRLPRFDLKLVQAFDLFPQTTHVETVAVLEPT